MTPDIRRLCVLIRSEMELWVEEQRAQSLRDAIYKKDAPRFIEIDGQTINTFEIVGIFTPEKMEERRRWKNGEWKCQKGLWHEKHQKCECHNYTETVVAHVAGVGEVKYKR